ncbi:hypothetical protein HY405_01050 [Candidatus Microgenomates bacterium]|nr:hypothetical protein [Candidatus Microgenomates bacterium]
MPAVEGIQLLLGIVIVTLSALLVFVGAQVILILREVRSTVQKLNTLLGAQLPFGGHTKFTTKPPLYLSLFTFLQQLIKHGKNAPIVSQVDSYFEQSRTAAETFMDAPVDEPTDDVVEAKSFDDPFPHIAALRERGRRSSHRLGESSGSESMTSRFETRRVFFREGKPLA